MHWIGISLNNSHVFIKQIFLRDRYLNVSNLERQLTESEDPVGLRVKCEGRLTIDCTLVYIRLQTWLTEVCMLDIWHVTVRIIISLGNLEAGRDLLIEKYMFSVSYPSHLTRQILISLEFGTFRYEISTFQMIITS